MQEKHLHIICLDVPYPADYGGLFDLFYKLIFLSRQGVKIHLHCFEYGRGVQEELNKYCVEVNYYKRKKGLPSFSLNVPYIVNSRRDEILLQNLLKDTHPILMEGIHCTYLLYKNKLLRRKVFIRLHNIESEYYSQLVKSATSFFKKIYYSFESRLLKKYEKEIAAKAIFIAVAKDDADTFRNNFSYANVKYLPVFIPYNSILSKPGKGKYCLYHGNLSVAENEKAVEWLIENVFNHLAFPFIIAGKNPSKNLLELLNRHVTIELIANPSEEEMNKLISKAHINILPSFNSTGIKIKLLNALFNGRFCLVNSPAVAGTGFENLCSVANDSDTFQHMILDLEEKIFTQGEIEMRKIILEKEFNNQQNALQLMQWIW